jgi:hypothetical protein
LFSSGEIQIFHPFERKKEFAMKRDQWIGLALAIGSIIAAVVLNRALYRAEAGLRLEMYVLPALGVLIGGLMIFTNFESATGLQEIIEELPEAVSDELEAIKKFQITFPIVAFFVSILGLIAEASLIFHFRKWNAVWIPELFGGVSVVLISTLVAIGTAYLCFISSWFQERYYRLRQRMFVIPLVAFVICAVLGGYYAEPRNYNELSLMQRDQLARSDQYSDSSRGSQAYYFIRSFGSSSSSIDIDTDCDDCGIVIIAIVCVAGSAIIPHFWVLATSLLLTIMIMVAIREVLYHERTRSHTRWR